MKAYLVTTIDGQRQLQASQRSARIIASCGGTYEPVEIPSSIKGGLLGFINDLLDAAQPPLPVGERDRPQSGQGEGTPTTCPACERTPAAASAIVTGEDSQAVTDGILAADLPALGRHAEAVADRFRELSTQAHLLAAAGGAG